LRLLIFDGDCNSKWNENLNTCIDDNKKLCLINGETIDIGDVKFVFITSDVKMASPAFISRLAIINIGKDDK